jgi:hypothetical protein
MKNLYNQEGLVSWQLAAGLPSKSNSLDETAMRIFRISVRSIEEITILQKSVLRIYDLC